MDKTEGLAPDRFIVNWRNYTYLQSFVMTNDNKGKENVLNDNFPEKQNFSLFFQWSMSDY